MLKTLATSKALQLACACACPVAGLGGLAVGVPQVRDAVHRATAPRQIAKSAAHSRPKLVRAAAAAPVVCPPPYPVYIGLPSLDAPRFGVLEDQQPIVGTRALPTLASAAPSRPFFPGFVAPISPVIGGIFIPGNPGAPGEPGIPPIQPGPGITPTPTPPPVESAVPEPAGWAAMVLGFGVIGYSLRRVKKPTAEPAPAAAA